eukprot:gene5968-9967_t
MSEQTLSNCVGYKIEIVNILNQKISGEIFSYDPQLELLALYISGHKHESSTRRDFKLIKTDTIKQITKLTKPTEIHVPFSDLNQPLPVVNFEKLQQREEFSIQYREKQLNPKVTIEGQILFDSLSKILPCFWRGDSIMVMDTIEIKPPYNLTSISGEPENSLQRN